MQPVSICFFLLLSQTAGASCFWKGTYSFPGGGGTFSGNAGPFATTSACNAYQQSLISKGYRVQGACQCSVTPSTGAERPVGETERQKGGVGTPGGLNSLGGELQGKPFFTQGAVTELQDWKKQLEGQLKGTGTGGTGTGSKFDMRTEVKAPVTGDASFDADYQRGLAAVYTDKCGSNDASVVDLCDKSDFAPVIMRDADGDGISDDLDLCSDTQAKFKVDQNGCPVDEDGDGIENAIDKCPGTVGGTLAGADGCSRDQMKAKIEQWEKNLAGIENNIKKYYDLTEKLKEDFEAAYAAARKMVIDKFIEELTAAGLDYAQQMPIDDKRFVKAAGKLKMSPQELKESVTLLVDSKQFVDSLLSLKQAAVAGYDAVTRIDSLYQSKMQATGSGHGNPGDYKEYLAVTSEFLANSGIGEKLGEELSEVLGGKAGAYSFKVAVLAINAGHEYGKGRISEKEYNVYLQSLDEELKKKNLTQEWIDNAKSESKKIGDDPEIEDGALKSR